jgi:competence protein ComEC
MWWYNYEEENVTGMQKPFWWLTNGVLVGVLAIVATLFVWQEKKQETFEVVFLDVGQGDAILIQDGETQVLIDGGRDGLELLSRLGRHVPFWDRSIEVVIASHPDSDHIGGLPSVLRNYRVDTVMTNGQTSDTEASQLFEELAREKAKHRLTIAEGSEVAFPTGATLRFLYPLTPIPSDSLIETNEGSLVARLDFLETSFLFTGDLPNEEYALANIQPVDVLKVAHHGSRFSTSGAFLDALKPTQAVVSVGENSYGHPHPNVLRNLKEREIETYRTDQEGDIIYQCDKAVRRCVRRE